MNTELTIITKKNTKITVEKLLNDNQKLISPMLAIEHVTKHGKRNLVLYFGWLKKAYAIEIEKDAML